MNELTPPMMKLIENYSAGAVATVNDDGTPAVSPKATFVIVDESHIAFGNIRSPGTAANLRRRPDVEVNFIDVLERRAVRVKGRAEVLDKHSDAARHLHDAFSDKWSPYLEHMEGFIEITITRAELILSPAYDIGLTARELRRINLEKLRVLG